MFTEKYKELILIYFLIVISIWSNDKIKTLFYYLKHGLKKKNLSLIENC